MRRITPYRFITQIVSYFPDRILTGEINFYTYNRLTESLVITLKEQKIEIKNLFTILDNKGEENNVNAALYGMQPDQMTIWMPNGPIEFKKDEIIRKRKHIQERDGYTEKEKKLLQDLSSLVARNL